MNWLKFIVLTTIIGVTNFLFGLWFLFRHPIRFMQFVEHYKRFASRIDEREELVGDLARSGYLGLNRKQRRAINRKANKVTA